MLAAWAAMNPGDSRTFDGLWTLNAQGGYTFTSSTTTAPCVPDWSCTTWTSCQNNRTSRSCSDRSRCGTSQGKPAEYADCAEEEGVVDLFPVDQPPAPSAPSEPAPEGGQAQGGGGGGGGGGGLARTSPQTQALPPVEKSSGGSSVTLLFRKPTSTGPAASIQEAIGLETNVMRSPANLDILSIVFVALVLSVALVVFIVHQERVHVPAFAREIHVPFLTEAARLTQLERILPGPGRIFNHGGYMNERIDPPPFLPRSDRVLPDFKDDLPLREILALLDERHKAERPSLEK